MERQSHLILTTMAGQVITQNNKNKIYYILFTKSAHVIFKEDKVCYSKLLLVDWKALNFYQSKSYQPTNGRHKWKIDKIL